MKDVHSEMRDGAAVVRPSVDLTGGDETDAVAAMVRAHAESGARCVILDLEQVRFINSMALGAIIACHVSLTNRGARLVLCNLDERNRKLIHITGLEAVLERHETLEEALAGGKAPPARG